MKKGLLLAAMMAVSGTALAEDGRSGSSHGLGARLGTDGIGLQYSYGLNRYVDLRAGYNFGSISYDNDDEDISYAGKLKFGALSALVDIKPFAGGFRVTAGAYSAPPEFTLEASGNDDYELGDSGETYSGNVSLAGGIDLGSAAPYLGIGWGGTTNGSGFGGSLDVGVLFTKSPKVNLRASGSNITDSNGNSFDIGDGSATDQEFQAALRQEISNLEEDAKDFKLWPVISLGVHYRF